MIVLDTSFLLRFFTRDDENKALQAKKLIESNEELLLIDAVLMELIYTLIKVYKLSKDDVVKVISFLLSRPNISINSKLIKAIKLYAEFNLSITDCLIIAHGKNNKIASYDNDLLKVFNKINTK
jgi:predicted nucleic-acid-binding protein